MELRTRLAEYMSLRSLGLIVAGTFLFSFGMNVFITPLGLFSGGFLGIAQLVRAFLVNVLGLSLGSADIAGILYFLMSVPLLILAYSQLGRPFFIKTLVCTGLYSFFLTVITGPEQPIFSDTLTSCIVGGLVAGVGAGLTLVSGGCGGGEEILCVYLAQKNPSFSVGRVCILINVLVFGCCAVFFNLPAAIYSVIYSVTANLTLDRVHFQRITMDVMIITKLDNMEQLVFDTVQRGVTWLHGEGGYTRESTNVLLTVVSKDEAFALKRAVRKRDPDAFIIVHDDIGVAGNFEMRL